MIKFHMSKSESDKRVFKEYNRSAGANPRSADELIFKNRLVRIVYTTIEQMDLTAL